MPISLQVNLLLHIYCTWSTIWLYVLQQYGYSLQYMQCTYMVTFFERARRVLSFNSTVQHLSVYLFGGYLTVILNELTDFRKTWHAYPCLLYTSFIGMCNNALCIGLCNPPVLQRVSVKCTRNSFKQNIKRDV